MVYPRRLQFWVMSTVRGLAEPKRKTRVSKRSPKRYMFSWEIVVQNVEMERLKRTFWKIGLFGPKHTKRYKKWSVLKRTFPKRAFCVSKRTFRVSKRTF